MARVLEGFHSFTCTPRVHPLTEWTIPAFAFPAEAGTHLLAPEGWKAELTLGGWLVAQNDVCRLDIAKFSIYRSMPGCRRYLPGSHCQRMRSVSRHWSCWASWNMQTNVKRNTIN